MAEEKLSMNQNAPEPSFELPPLPQEVGESAFGVPQETGARPEIAPPPPAQSQPLQPAPVPVPHMTSAPASPVAPLPLQPASQSATSLSADDNDLIEKEWVVKAKQIVAATREDPHLQNRELSKIKADYLKKRYGKDIKVDES